MSAKPAPPRSPTPRVNEGTGEQVRRGRSRQARALEFLAPPPPIPDALRERIAAAKIRLARATDVVRAIWAKIDRATASKWDGSSPLNRYVIAAQADDRDLELELHDAQRLESEAKADLNRLERESERIQLQPEPAPPSGPSRPTQSGDRVVPIWPAEPRDVA
jgi:hypothetical protein